MRFLLSPRALKDLEIIYDHIAKDQPASAAATIERLIEAMKQLETHPKLGREGRRLNTRELVHQPFIIVYRIRKERIEVAAVIHGKRKYE